ncbi:hypothetical protein [Agarilytica rhodophyticola]|uniref:hypothetical protein n=1 Tax=Agarilytica rhodophyticola TaxID=1737490 RepID=UPI0013152E86|nr:hypothetical protein [Agarilytica rhodophyticola]
MKEEPLFYLRDSRSNTGSNATFWGKGYTDNLHEAQVFTLQKAQAQHDCRETDIPLLKSAVDALAIMHVDMQYLRDVEEIDESNEYVIQHKNYYNGNDILFFTDCGQSYDYSKAKVFTKFNAMRFVKHSGLSANSCKIFSKSSIDKIARPTFQFGNIDTRTMITKPGIKYNRPKRKRPTTGKTRHNCFNCGKIVWDYIPDGEIYCSRECEDKHDLYSVRW